MTRILVQRGSSGSSSSSSSSSQNRSSSSGTASASSQQQATSNVQVVPAADDENLVEVHVMNELSENLCVPGDKSEETKTEDPSPQSLNRYQDEGKTILEEEKLCDDPLVSGNLSKESGGLPAFEANKDVVGSSIQMMIGSPDPSPPPVPSSKPSSTSWRFSSADSSTVRIGSSRRVSGWPGVSILSSPTGSHPSSPRSHCEGEGYNSADEQKPCFSSSYDDAEREHQFVIELRRVRGLEVRKMLEDGNCLFRAIADQVYGDSELFDLVRQMCIDYMERERDHFSQFITEGFVSYCKRKRRDMVYGNNVEIQALSEMYNRPIHIYSYSTEPLNTFHGSYETDTPPMRLSYHHGNHYNSLIDPRRLNIGAGLGLNSLQGANIDKDQVKAAIKAQQDQQIDNALLAEGRFYSDIELTEKEIERMVMEASRAEYLADNKLKQEHSCQESSSTSRAEPSSSAARSSRSNIRMEGDPESGSGPSSALSSSRVQTMLSMGFSYLQVMEAHQIFGDDVDAMVFYLIETSSSGRRKGKAAE